VRSLLTPQDTVYLHLPGAIVNQEDGSF